MEQNENKPSAQQQGNSQAGKLAAGVSSRMQKHSALPVDTQVCGVVDRFEKINVNVYAFTLVQENRHETFVLHVTNFDESIDAGLTRSGDKVQFTIKEEDTYRPRVRHFENLEIN